MKLHFAGIYFILFPFYFFPSGRPQIADLFGVLLIIFSLDDIIKLFLEFYYLKLASFFVTYTWIVNLFYALLYQEASFIIPSIQYTYCFFLACSLICILKGHFFGKKFLNYILISMFLQFCLWPFIERDWGYRTVLYFNNPNQLALWSINLLLISYVYTEIYRISYWKRFCIFFVITILAILSVSKAVLAAFSLFWIGQLFRAKKLFIILLLGPVVFSTYYYTDVAILSNVVNRFETDNLTDDNLNARGFDRILNHYELMLIGAGEGNYARFNSVYHGEIHSSFFNILFSYGLTGCFIFSMSVFLMFYNTYNTESIILLICMFIFTTGHMTLRIPLFWTAIYSLHFLNTKPSPSCVV